MKDWIAKLFSGNDHDVSVLHVVLVFAIVLFSVPVVFVAGLTCAYAWYHGWTVMPEFGHMVKDCADAYAMVTGSTGLAWALKGGGTALQNLNTGGQK